MKKPNYWLFYVGILPKPSQDVAIMKLKQENITSST